MAILMVLWGMALMAVVAVSLQLTGTVSYRLARNTLDTAVAQVTAEAAVHRAVLALLEPRPDRRWPMDGTPRTVGLNGRMVTVAIQDELGRIDLNHADVALFASLFRSVGLDPQAASQMADRIGDWRDASPGKRPGGASDQDYRLAGYDYGPRNGPFQSVDELLLVMGMTPDLFRRIEPALTVYSGRARFDPAVAPREALLALPDMTADRAAALVAERGRPGQAFVGQALGLPGRSFAIRVEMDRSGRRVVETAAVRLTGDPGHPFWMLAWRTR